MTGKIATLILTLIALSANAQDKEYPYPSLSPKGVISQTVGNTTLEIEYERPSVRKRNIFGELVPWNKVWRTGAGYCTKISFDRNVIVGGQKVETGKYSLFTIPNQNEWIVILNKDTSLYGSFDYDYKKDAARFVVIPRKSNRFYESLNFDVEILPNNARVFISWANTQISFDIETATDDKIEKFIQNELLTKRNKESDTYAGAAEYLLYQGSDLVNAITLADYALELDQNNGWARVIKVMVYEKLKLFDNALSEIKQAIENNKSRKYKSEKERQNSLRQWELEYERISKLM